MAVKIGPCYPGVLLVNTSVWFWSRGLCVLDCILVTGSSEVDASPHVVYLSRMGGKCVCYCFEKASHFDSRLSEFFRHAGLSGSDGVRGDPVLIVLVGVVVDLPCHQIRPRDAMLRRPDQTNVPIAGAPWAGLGDMDYPIMMTEP